MSAPPYKFCPVCRQPADLHAPQCVGCGHVFRTQFQTDPTLLGPPPGQPYQQPQPPPGYPPPGYPPPGYPPQYQPYSPYPVPPPGYVQVLPGTHSPGLAVLFSLLITGGGQLYNRQVTKGLVFLFGQMALGVAMWLFTVATLGVGALAYLFIGPLLLALYITLSIDAYKIGERLNRGELVGPWQWF